MHDAVTNSTVCSPVNLSVDAPVNGDSGTLVLVRIGLADRPGALSSVTRRIGAVRGDVVSIEILERSSGTAIDEVVVRLPLRHLVDAMVSELGKEDDVEVQEVIPLDDTSYDPFFDTLDLAALIAGATDHESLYSGLCDAAARAVRCDWLCIVDPNDRTVASHGVIPDRTRPADFVTRAGDGDRSGCAVWMPLPNAGSALVVHRESSPFRARERHRVAALARVADSLYSHICAGNRLDSLLRHPSLGD